MSTVPTLLRTAYATHGARPAITCGEEFLTYDDLRARTERVRAAFAAAGIGPGERMAIVSGSRPEHVVVDHAAWIAGVVRVALNQRLHPHEVASILNIAAPSIVFCDGEWAPKLAAVAEELPPFATVVCFETFDRPIGDARVVAFEDWLAEEAPIGASWRLTEEDPGPDDVAALQFTSGTSGKPKAVAVTHRVLEAMVRNILIEAAATPGDVLLNPLPFYQPGAFFALAHFVRGAHVLIVAKFDPVEALSLAQEHGVTTILTAPAMVPPLVLAAEAGEVSLPALRTMIYGGSSMPVADVVKASRTFGPVLLQMYGQTEAGLPLTALSKPDHVFDPAGEPPAHLASAGRPTPYLDIRVVDDEGSQLAVGEIGEIVIRGNSVMSGYWNDPEATAEVLDADGWFHTGDLGRFDAEGYLYIVGRSKDLIISGGFNVYPIEVEQVVARLPEVAEVAVIGVPDERWGEAVCAVIVPADGATIDPDAVLAACGAELARFKTPRRIEIAAAMPRNASGKILKRDLRERYSTSVAAL
jgi:acyl-CoA synthetase (AMP-forming)/AMP-acid ligase II